MRNGRRWKWRKSTASMRTKPCVKRSRQSLSMCGPLTPFSFSFTANLHFLSLLNILAHGFRLLSSRARPESLLYGSNYWIKEKPANRIQKHRNGMSHRHIANICTQCVYRNIANVWQSWRRVGQGECDNGNNNKRRSTPCADESGFLFLAASDDI